jgi:hypothetical protein
MSLRDVQRNMPPCLVPAPFRGRCSKNANHAVRHVDLSASSHSGAGSGAVHAPGELGQVHTNPASMDELEQAVSMRHFENENPDEGTVCKRPRVTAFQADLSPQTAALTLCALNAGGNCDVA